MSPHDVPLSMINHFIDWTKILHIAYNRAVISKWGYLYLRGYSSGAARGNKLNSTKCVIKLYSRAIRRKIRNHIGLNWCW